MLHNLKTRIPGFVIIGGACTMFLFFLLLIMTFLFSGFTLDMCVVSVGGADEYVFDILKRRKLVG